MSSSDPFPLEYDRATVTSAQRLRLLKSNRPLFILTIVVLFSLSSIWDKLLPWIQGKTPMPVEMYATLYGFALVIIVLAVLYIALPLLDPLVNRWWRSEYQLALSPEGLRLMGQGGASLDVEWARVKRVLRNERALLLFYGKDNRDFIVLPRESLRQAGKEALLDQYLETAARGRQEALKTKS